MKPPQNGPGPLRWKITLNIGNTEDEYGKQQKYFNSIVNEEMDAAANPRAHIQAENIFHQQLDQFIQPLHLQKLIIERIKNRCD